MTNSVNKMTPQEQAREMAKECVEHYYQNSMGFTMEDAIAEMLLPLCLLNSAVEKLDDKIKSCSEFQIRCCKDSDNEWMILWEIENQKTTEDYDKGNVACFYKNISTALIKLSEKL